MSYGAPVAPPPNAFCPHCGQRAPIILRGLEARCTACGGARLPFTARSLNLAGQPARIGGTAATIAGWAVLGLGLFVATMITLLLQLVIWPTGVLGWVLGIPIALLAIVFGGGLLFGGSKLRQAGSEKRKSVQLETIRAAAAHRRGSLTTAEAARALDLPEPQADALLTELAKNPDENVSLDIDDDGGIRWNFGKGDERWRILAENDAKASREAEAEALAESETEAEARRAKR
jgi:hypothetical protein